jgi:hypothetical protein
MARRKDLTDDELVAQFRRRAHMGDWQPKAVVPAIRSGIELRQAKTSRRFLPATALVAILAVAAVLIVSLGGLLPARPITTAAHLPTGSPDGTRRIRCSGGLDYVVVDSTALVSDCVVIFEAGGTPTERISNPGGDQSALLVSWGDSSCNGGHWAITFERVAQVFGVTLGKTADAPPESNPPCGGVPMSVGIRMTLLTPITATDVFDLSDPPVAYDQDGDFRLMLSAGRSTYAAGEPIDIEAALRYVGTSKETISGLAEFIVFSLDQVDGTIQTTPASRLMCGSWDFEPGQTRIQPFTKMGSYDDDGPLATFFRSYFSDPVLRLPAGIFKITAGISFNPGIACPSQEALHHLSASIVITTVATSTPPPTPDPTPEPVSTPSPTADQAVVIECSEYPDPEWQWTGHATIYDETGFIDSCETTVPERPTTQVTVSNLADDMSTLRVTWTAGPCAGYQFRFAGTTGGYTLDFTPAACGFASLQSHEFRLHLQAPIDASQIEVTWRGQPLPTPEFDCPTNAIVYDETALVQSCEKFEAPATTEEIAVANARGDETVLRVIWLASTCTLKYEFRFRQASVGYALDGSLGPGAVCFATFPAPNEIRLRLSEPVDASTVMATMTYVRATPSP